MRGGLQADLWAADGRRPERLPDSRTAVEEIAAILDMGCAAFFGGKLALDRHGIRPDCGQNGFQVRQAIAVVGGWRFRGDLAILFSFRPLLLLGSRLRLRRRDFSSAGTLCSIAAISA